MSFPRPDAQEACGARNRHGEPCKNWPSRYSHSLKRRCRFHGGQSLEGTAHPGFTHGTRTRGLREVAAKLRAAHDMSWLDHVRLTALVRAKRAELVALVLTIEEMQRMTKAEIRAYLGLPLSSHDTGRR
jgi:hypothetical protein